MAVAPPLRAEVRLDQVIYSIKEGVQATVRLMPRTPIPKNPKLILVGSRTKDVEVVPLKRVDARTLTTAKPTLLVEAGADGVAPDDGRLALQPGETFFAIYSVVQGQSSGPKASRAGDLAAAFAQLEDEKVTGQNHEVIPKLAMTDDERKVPAGGKRIGTIAPENGLPVQIALDELIFYPRDEQQLKDFLRDTKGKVIEAAEAPKGSKRPPPVLVSVGKRGSDVRHLAQLRALYGEDTAKLLASSEEALHVYASVLEHRVRGYVAGVNPRLQLMGAPTTRDGPVAPSGPAIDVMSADPNVCPPPFADDLFGIQRAWSYVTLFERDSARIPIAFLDMGFAPNWDFRGFPSSIPQRSLEDGTSGPGSAAGPPTVGNSFFGPTSWHGTGVVTTGAGVLNNGFGSAGTGGQVAEPMLYKTGLRSYAFELGTGMRLAVDDGATVINISAGYPCTVVTNIGVDFRICSPAARAAFCAFVQTELRTAVAAALLVPIVGPILAAVAEAAADTALLACLAIVLLGDPRGPMEDGVAYAREHGVTVVSIAGNKQTPQNLGPLASVVPTGTQDVGQWEVVPGVIPGVICCGAALPTPPYPNDEFFGNRVDIWAPILSWYYAPPTTGRDDGPTTHQLQMNFGGTSAAAPYVSGVIAMMQAVNPELDPRTATLTPTQRRAIPARIRSLLMSTATPATSLPSDTSNPEVARRRNLINAFRAVRAAAAGALPDVNVLGYDLRVGFEERAVAEQHDTLATAKIVGPAGGTERGTILRLTPAGPPGGGSTYSDVDWYSFRMPPVDGVFSGATIELRQPVGADHVSVNDNPGATEVRVGDEILRTYPLPDLFGRASFAVKISGWLGGDNIYKATIRPGRRMADGPQPDRFDRPEGNPPGWQDNDAQSRAVPLGADRFSWSEVEAMNFWDGTTFRIHIPDLNFHRAGDLDWFSLEPPQGFDALGSPDCPAYLRIVAGDGVVIDVLGADGRLIAHSDSGRIELRYDMVEGRFPLFFVLRSATGGPVTYDLDVIASAPNPLLCALARRIRALRQIERIYHSGLYYVDPNPPDPAPDVWRQYLRADQPAALLWRKTGAFRLDAAVESDRPLRLSLLDSGGKRILTTATGGVQPKAHARPAAERGPQSLTLRAPKLEGGIYALQFDDVEATTAVELMLPKNAVTWGSLSVESRLKGDRQPVLAAGFEPVHGG